MNKIIQPAKFLLFILMLSGGLTCAALFGIRSIEEQRIRISTQKDLRNLASVYQRSELQREFAPARSAEVLANLPTIRAMMTTEDPKTIQDASADVWHICACDFLLLSNSAGIVLALQPNNLGFDRGMAQVFVRQSIEGKESRDWWFGSGHLYEVWIEPIYLNGLTADKYTLGFLAVGREIDENAAKEFSKLLSADVVFQCGDNITGSTLQDAQLDGARRYLSISSKISTRVPEVIELGSKRYFVAALDLKPSSKPPVFLWVFRPIDGTSLLVGDVNLILLCLGLTSILAGSILLFLIADTGQRILGNAFVAVRKACLWLKASLRKS